ncbi:MAG: HIT family protein [Candidatus Nanohalobium sp.]
MFEGFRAKLKAAYMEKVKQKCIFCSIIREEDEKIVYRNEEIAVFPTLESDALKEGHLLVVPVEHYENIFEMDREEVETFFGEIKEIADSIKEKTSYTGVNMLSANGGAAQQSVKHVHTHIVLREDEDGYDLWPETGYGGESFEEVNGELSSLLN